jgi:hypothetical protein
MSTEEQGFPADIEVVRWFLRKYYLSEESEDRAASHALRDHTHGNDRQKRWQVAQALQHLLDTHLSTGILQNLVFHEANRDVLTDAEAREFLERVYEDNAFDVAVNFDELKKEDP